MQTDKASLLAEVIQHVKDLKHQTCEISQTSPVPTEMDELTVDNSSEFENGKWVVKVSICCQDRPDLLPDLITTLKALRLKTLRAEITTLGGRVRNVLFVTGDDDVEDDQEQFEYSIDSIEEALRGIMEKSSNGDNEPGTGSVKRQRTNTTSIIDYASL